MLRIGNHRAFTPSCYRADLDEDPYNDGRYGACKDCGSKLQTGQERADELCYTCVRERAG